jgi:hypothetical protein
MQSMSRMHRVRFSNENYLFQILLVFRSFGKSLSKRMNDYFKLFIKNVISI